MTWFILIYGGFQLAMGVPNRWMLFVNGKIPLRWTMNGGTPMTKRKPPYPYSWLIYDKDTDIVLTNMTFELKLKTRSRHRPIWLCSAFSIEPWDPEQSGKSFSISEETSHIYIYSICIYSLIYTLFLEYLYKIYGICIFRWFAYFTKPLPKKSQP